MVALDRKMVGVEQKMVGLDRKMVNVEQKMVELDQKMVNVEQKMVELDQKMVNAEQKTVALHQKLVDVEQKSLERHGIEAVPAIQIPAGIRAALQRSLGRVDAAGRTSLTAPQCLPTQQFPQVQTSD